MKFNTTKTKGGYKILNIIGPDIEGRYGGAVESPDGDFLGCTWGRSGIERDGDEAYYLIPLDEPKPDHKIEARLEALEERLQTLEYDNKEYNTWGVRVNGDLQELHNRILRLERKTADTSDYHNLRLQIQDVEKQLEALEQRTKTDEKAVWVTRKMLVDAYLKTGNINDLAKRLGLEE